MNKTLFIIIIVVSISVVLASATTYRKINNINGIVEIPDLPKIPNPADLINKPEPLVAPTNLSEAVEANNKFAIDLYKQLNQEDKNIFYSPYSVSTALAMVYEGARGNTATEMQNALGFQENDLDRHASFKYLYSKINNSRAETKSSTANALWIQQDYKILNSYLNIVKQVYGGNSVNLDFKNQKEKSRKTINTWVEDQTNKKIVELLPSSAIKDDTKLILTNAIYFNGKWKYKFDKNETIDYQFETSTGTKNKIKMMSQRGAEFKYAEKDGIQILEMPYTDNDLVMRILLPQSGEMKSLEAMVTAEKLLEWKDALSERKVNIAIPKFKLETEYGMVPALRKLGISNLFADSADLSGIDGTQGLYVSDVIHKAFVDVFEEGTEAAAATAVVVTLKSAPVDSTPNFIADHPFLFMIEDTSNGSILFMGKVSDLGSDP